MKVFISLDMEGISGITEWEDTIPGRRHYEAGRRLLTQDVNAAIAGAFGVPVVLVTGDLQTAQEVEEDIPGIFTVAVKTGITRLSSQAMHPVRARELIRS